MSLFANLFRRPKMQPTTVSGFTGGPVLGYLIPENGLPTHLWQPSLQAVKRQNSILYQGADVLALILGGSAGYRVSAMYFEFVKSSTSYAKPTFARDTANYYSTLRLNDAANSDFLRVPLDVVPNWSSTDGAKYANNKVQFFAQTSDSTGEREKATSNGFTFATGDKVIGGALVATPGDGVEDDLIFARFYFETGDEIVKVAGHQVGLAWPVQFT